MKVIVETTSSSKEEIFQALENFEKKGRKISPGKRNLIKAISIDEKELNIKAFKVPNAVNKIAYRFFRKSKAERSFRYAKELLRRGINTPAPIAYAEEVTAMAFLKSFYVSQHLDYDLTFRDIDLTKEGHDKILRAFTRFTFELHEKGIQFLDHSPGNTLIRLNDGDYQFYLVDLNRMRFKSLDFTDRMKNFERVGYVEEQVEIMANEYASLINKPEKVVFEKMWFFSNSFLSKRAKERKMKKKFKSFLGMK